MSEQYLPNLITARCNGCKYLEQQTITSYSILVAGKATQVMASEVQVMKCRWALCVHKE